MTDSTMHPTHKPVNWVAQVPEYQGILSWITSIDHKQIGLMYLMSAFGFLVVGAFLGLTIRIQLMFPMSHFVSQEAYNQIFTMHGTTMIFFVGMPLFFGFAMYLTPLMIGARDMAFPRLNAFGYWVYIFGAAMLFFSFLAGGAPAAGWFAYPPLSEKGYMFNSGQTYWALSLLVTGIGSVATGINLIVTIMTMRAPGMTLKRVPLFVWMIFMDAFLVVFSLPALNAALVMILFDRTLHTHFFDATMGGSPLLWQHFFWFFGHPEVYILILPGWGAISEVIPVFSRKLLFGAGVMAASTVAITFLSFGVWVHHMFTTGLGFAPLYIFAVTSLLIAVPTGIKIWSWLATMWGGKLKFSVAMLHAMAFLIQFTIGGLSGVMFAVIPIDWQLTDSYFVVAHFHYVLVGGMLFSLIAGVYYWYPKATGRLMSETLGLWQFWLMVIGFNGTFFVMHILGILGMPRRVWTYPLGMPGWAELNLFSSCCSFILVGSILLFVYNLFWSFYHGKVAGPNPWNAWTLEWLADSPPIAENFERVPVVRSRRPLWDLQLVVEAMERDMLNQAIISKPTHPLDTNVKINRNVLGMLLFIGSESMFFLLLIFAYINFHNQYGTGAMAAWHLNVVKTGMFSIALFSSSFTMWLAERAHAKQSGLAILWMLITIGLGATFIAGQGFEYAQLIQENLTISRDMFGTTFFTLTGFHGLHVIVGLILLSVALWIMIRGKQHDITDAGLMCVSLYWHFVDLVWVAVFSVVYLWRFVQ